MLCSCIDSKGRWWLCVEGTCVQENGEVIGQVIALKFISEVKILNILIGL